jgi:hypothetical protein
MRLSDGGGAANQSIGWSGPYPARPPYPLAQPRTFTHEFAALSQAIANDIGQPIECSHVDPASGDVL